MNKHNSPRKLQQHRIQKNVRKTSAVDFFNVLTGPLLLDLVEAHLPDHRERLYPPTVALSLFIKQALEEDGSCQRAVNGWAAQRSAEGLCPQSVRTGGYCQARKRLPTEMVAALVRETGKLLCMHGNGEWLWRGRTVKLVDGTGISMPDTPENQARYPQPDSQAPGVGFPLMRMVGVICLSTGGVIDVATGRFGGKGTGEQSLFRSLLGAFDVGDVVLADALYCDYWLIAMLQSEGVDVVFEQNGSRHTDFRRGRQLGKRDHVVCWQRPPRPGWMTPEEYEAFPDVLTVRETKADERVLVTTLLNGRQVPKKALADLYVKRWHVELDFRNIKTTLGMEVLRCLSPEMVDKELWVNLLAYNLIRLLMVQAALESGLQPRQLSFKHTAQLWVQWSPLHRKCNGCWERDRLLGFIVQIKVGLRPGRSEPRARKRRPKPYPWLKEPRDVARRQTRRSG